jgi:hypothetical protein
MNTVDRAQQYGISQVNPRHWHYAFQVYLDHQWKYSNAKSGDHPLNWNPITTVLTDWLNLLIQVCEVAFSVNTLCAFRNLVEVARKL